MVNTLDLICYIIFFGLCFLQHKCEHYWPDSEPRLYGDIWVEQLKQEQLADFTMRTFQLTKVSLKVSGLYTSTFLNKKSSRKKFMELIHVLFC